jgi:hypothetical protein
VVLLQGLDKKRGEHLALLFMADEQDAAGCRRSLDAAGRRRGAQPGDKSLQRRDLRLGLQHLTRLHILQEEETGFNNMSNVSNSFVDPGSLSPDPTFQLNPNPGLLWPKIGKNTAKNNLKSFFDQKCKLLIQRPP